MFRSQKRTMGHVDSVIVNGVNCEIAGWTIDGQGRPFESIALRLGEQVVERTTQSMLPRPDVVNVHSHAHLQCGFQISVLLSDLRMDNVDSDDVVLMMEGGGCKFELPVPGWPIEAIREVSKSSVPVPDVPHMPPEAIERLTELLQDSKGYLEYGTGGSTLLACRMGVPYIAGVESDRQWLEAVRHRIEGGFSQSELDLLHVDIGETGDWGFPVSDSHWRHYAEYPTAPWQTNRMRERVDIVLIDGRFRMACFVASALLARPGTRILFDDYFDRPCYFGVEALVQPAARHDRMAEFVVPAEMDKDRGMLALIGALADVR